MCLQDEFYFRALELLRWDGDYLLLAHGVSDNLGFGLKRSSRNQNTLLLQPLHRSYRPYDGIAQSLIQNEHSCAGHVQVPFL